MVLALAHHSALLRSRQGKGRSQKNRHCSHGFKSSVRAVVPLELSVEWRLPMGLHVGLACTAPLPALPSRLQLIPFRSTAWLCTPTALPWNLSQQAVLHRRSLLCTAALHEGGRYIHMESSENGVSSDPDSTLCMPKNKSYFFLPN